MIIEPSPSPVLSTTFFSGTFLPFTCKDIIASPAVEKLSAKHVLSRVEGPPSSQHTPPCHFDRREKSFLDPSRSLGMTGQDLSLGELCAFARECFVPIFFSLTLALWERLSMNFVNPFLKN